MKEKATLIFDTVKLDLDILKAQKGSHTLDIQKLNSLSDHFTYDPGYKNTAVCQSSLCFIDGNKGILEYCGYDISDVVSHLDFLQTYYLLSRGKLSGGKSDTSYVSMMSTITEAQQNPPAIIHQTLQTLSSTAHPMSTLMTLMAVLSGHLSTLNQSNSLILADTIIGLTPFLIASVVRHHKGETLPIPLTDPSYAKTFLRLLLDKPVDQEMIDITDKLLILHADHEQNASTSTVRSVATTGVNLCAALTSGIASLWGPAHGGANEACVDMLMAIQETQNIPSFLERAKDKSDSFRLMGFGHRVYKNYDPRAKILKSLYTDFVKKQSHNPLFELALSLEKQALADPYFVDHKLFPNIDYYSGITQLALDIPKEAFTCFFALGRMSGWCSHWLEQTNNPSQNPLVRPRQLYIGSTSRRID